MNRVLQGRGKPWCLYKNTLLQYYTTHVPDPFETVTLPEVIEEYLDHGSTTCVALNSRGTICAGIAVCVRCIPDAYHDA